MNIYLDMVGCRLNQAEIEQMAGQFRAKGHIIVPAADLADIVVVNTCSVTAEAASDSRQKIRQAARTETNKIIVTGCWSTLQPQQAAELPNVLRVVPNNQKDTLVWDFLQLEHPQNSNIGADEYTFEQEPIVRTPIPGLRQRTRAFIKAQDGCDNACTFCITSIARGIGHSRPAQEVITNIQVALNGGAREIVLTGVHLGSWGNDFGHHLQDLIKQILEQTDIPRLRLSSLEPWDLHDDFFSLWSDPRLCRHLHLPLQSGSGATLKRMLRKTSPESFKMLVEAARNLIPGVAITTDLIAGFPGESEAEFDETLLFVREINFAGGHVFNYSARPGTPAARIKEQISKELRKHRSQLLHTALLESSINYRNKFIGKILPVLWEASATRSETGWQIEGLTDNYIRVASTASELRWNQLDNIKLTGLNEHGMTGIFI